MCGSPAKEDRALVAVEQRVLRLARRHGEVADWDGDTSGRACGISVRETKKATCHTRKHFTNLLGEIPSRR